MHLSVEQVLHQEPWKAKRKSQKLVVLYSHGIQMHMLALYMLTLRALEQDYTHTRIHECSKLREIYSIQVLALYT